jgi:uncharacterized protein (DUF983 family)
MIIGADAEPCATDCASPLTTADLVAGPAVLVAVIVAVVPFGTVAVIESTRASVSSVHTTVAVPVASVVLVTVAVVPA